MKIINVQELKFIKLWDRGAYSRVYLVEFEGKKYCFKWFEFNLPKKMMNRVCEFTELEFPSEYLFPLFIVESKNGRFKLGYLTAYDPSLDKITNISDRKMQIKLLKSAKIVINGLHNDLKYVHGDLHEENILFNQSLVSSAILDFDTSIKLGEHPDDVKLLTKPLRNYLKYYKFDEKIDIYRFNLSTLQVLSSEYQDKRMLKMIAKNQVSFIEENKNVKRLAKELLFEDVRKPYSGEFLIDYID